MKFFRLDNYSLNGLYLILVLLATFLSAVISVAALVHSLTPSLSGFQQKEQKAELKISANFLNNYLRNQYISYQDLANLPIVIQTAMGGVKQDPDLIDFIKEFRVLGNLDPLVILDINRKQLLQRGGFHIDLKSFLRNEDVNLAGIVDGKVSKLLKLHSVSEEYFLLLMVPVIYSGYAEGVLLVEIDLSDSPILDALALGSDKSMVFLQKGEAYSNNVPYQEILENPEDYTELRTDIETFDLELAYYQDRSVLNLKKQEAILRVSVTLILGILLFSLLLYFLGKKLILEPTKRIEDSEKEQRLFRAIIENTNDAVVMTEADSFSGPDHPQIIYVNSAFKQLSGFESEEVIGKTPRILQGDDTDLAVRADIRRALEKEKHFNGELLNYSKEGKPYWVEINVFPIRNDKGKLLYFGAVERDITERKEFLSKIESTSQRLSLATEAAQIGVWDWDVEKGTLLWSLEMYSLYGLDKDVETSYDVWTSALHPEDREKVEQAIEKALAGDEDFNATFRVVTSSGVVKYMRALAQVIRGEEGLPLQMVGVNYDVTAQAEHQEAMARAKSEAEEASRMKSEFLANMSHEIRTPINGVIGAANVLAKMNLGDDEEKLVQTICRSGEALLVLINDILDLSKIEAEKMELEHQAFDPTELMEEMRDLFQLRAQEKGLSLEILCEGELPHLMMGDRGRLWQVLTNLIGNAFKFTEKGSVTVRLRRESPHDGQVRISVEDTGLGISSEHQEHLFESFRQVDASITRKFGGTGLGLTISRKLVEMMGGMIGLESEPNVGSTFWFQIPLELAPEGSGVISKMDGTEKGDAESADSQLEGNILVCEDNRTNIDVLKAMLGQLGEFEISTASNGRAGVAQCMDHKYSMILMDVQMPILDGLMATQLIRQQDGPNKNTAIVALTANALSGDREKCLEAGMDDYLSKPILPDPLRSALKKWLKRTSSPEEDLKGIVSPVDHDEVTEAPKSDVAVALDVEVLYGRLMGDRSLAKDVLEAFIEESTDLISRLISSLENWNLEESGKLAHTLKGATSNVSADALNALFVRLESALRSESKDEVGLIKESLPKELKRLEEEIGKIV